MFRLDLLGGRTSSNQTNVELVGDFDMEDEEPSCIYHGGAFNSFSPPPEDDGVLLGRTPPNRSFNPIAHNISFMMMTEKSPDQRQLQRFPASPTSVMQFQQQQGAEIGLLSMSPPTRCLPLTRLHRATSPVC